MKIKDIFQKDIKRPIEGVIKADDQKHLLNEVEEYVLTNEVAQNLESMLDAYNNYEGGNGVWISGFFGSGKSHLLKMLAFLLENRSIDEKPVLDMFLPKCGDNEMLRADLKKAAGIPSKSVLFNIDQKADIISKKDIDAVLLVFMKVFDEMCGYYGKQGYIAKFERDLDSRDEYQEFMENYREVAGRDWEKGREETLLESDNIAAAYARTRGMDDENAASDIIDKYREEYRVSIEDFAEQVKRYIDSQDKDFRINFFVDEVGQYVAGNVKLMTNLQTIAESLGTKCGGRAWLFVTAQQEMKDVLGEKSGAQSTDFSKIRDRFKTRISLTSRDVEEVIQKRLLAKKESCITELSDIYSEQENNFMTLFGFSGSSRKYRNFQGLDHFISCYPFIPYQFTLFQTAIQNLSAQNAFQGKHQSVGERSMLAVFKEVVEKISDSQLGRIASFDRMFDGISETLKSNHQSSILVAEKNLDDEFALRVLKALFLVKYIKEFKADLRNIGILMLDSFSADITSFHDKIKSALELLENQSYIQFNGEEYEFLTDEEKDIEQEIKNTEVEDSAILDEMSKMIFDDIIKTKKIRHSEYNLDFSFTRKVDGRQKGREHELSLNIITPFNENYDNQNVIFQSMGRSELLVRLPGDDRMLSDLIMYKRTEKYVRQNVSVTQKESKKKILSDKQFHNNQLLGRIEQQLKELISHSELIIEGKKLDVSASEPVERISRGFEKLVSRTYSNLRMLGKYDYTEQDLDNILRRKDKELFEGDEALNEPESEVLNLVRRNKASGKRTTIKEVVSHFEGNTYGWPLMAILCQLGRLCVRGEIDLVRDSNLIDEDKMKDVLLNTHTYGNVIIDLRERIDPRMVNKLRKFYGDFFDQPPSAGEAKSLGKEASEAFGSLVEELKTIADKKHRYPFLAVLEEPVGLICECTGKSYKYYLLELPEQHGELLRLKEQVIDPVRHFMSGSPLKIYDDISEFLKLQGPNLDYLEGEEKEELKGILNDPECFRGDSMRRAKKLKSDLEKRIGKLREEELEAALKILHDLRDNLKEENEFKELSADDEEKLLNPFKNFESELKQKSLISMIRERIDDFKKIKYPGILKNMSEMAGEKKELKYVTFSKIRIDFNKTQLKNRQDLEEYVAALRRAVEKALEEGKRISL
ncbi:MAG: BREX system P-loop protein BrxC [Candidatus Krumholzibacteriota bacterium]|nr:BREX system P-loop protein BrxC [Candidatus Krumholzibacteriota bacterium]